MNHAAFSSWAMVSLRSSADARAMPPATIDSRPLHALDQHAVAVLDVGELVDHRRHRGAPPGPLRLGVQRRGTPAPGAGAGSARRRDRRCPSAATTPGIPATRTPPRPVGARTVTAVAAPVRGSAKAACHPGGAAVLGEHPLGPAAHDHPRAGLDRVAQVGAADVELGPRPVAQADVARRVRRVGARVRVAAQRRERPTQRGRALAHALVRDR